MEEGAFVYGRGMYETESRPRSDPHGHGLTRCQLGTLAIIRLHVEFLPFSVGPLFIDIS